MPHRWHAAQALPDAAPDGIDAADTHATAPTLALVAAPTALPFPEASLDLVALPHTLAYCPDPAAALREISRVLVHEGRLVVSGFNRASLWGLFGALPTDGNIIGPRRLRALLRGTELELESLRHGGYGLAPHDERRTAQRLSPPWSARLWPARGALWCAVIVKRSPGMKLVGPSWKTQLAPANAQPGVAQRTKPAVDSVR
jgi:SAM-dependent methyltransferase